MKVLETLFHIVTIWTTFVVPGESSPANVPNPVDYVIVGAGPAGYVLAERLSRNPAVQVVLLEAGPDGTFAKDVNVPAYAPLLGNSTQYVWNFTVQPDPNLGGRSPALAQGHALGGGTAVNYMGYCRGAPAVFDQWANETGIQELKWDNFLSSFEETTHYAEQALDYKPSVDKQVYGSGPVEVTAVSDTLGINLQFAQAASDVLGVPIRDTNAGHGTGTTTGILSIRAQNHTREYALEAYGWAMAGRPNVRIIPDMLVTKINFQGACAVGVTLNDSSTVTAKETIVSAGAINSPKLLMLSGIGPRQHLEELGINVVVANENVGSHLTDHHFSVLEYEVTRTIQTAWQWSENSTGAALFAEQYQENYTGPLATNGGVGFALARIPNDVFQGVTNSSFFTSMSLDRGQLLYADSNAPFLSPSPNESIISAYVALVQPQAAGYIRLNSTQYKDAPLIFANYYGSPADKAAIEYGYKKLREIMQRQVLASALVREVFPGTNVTSDQDLWKAIQKSAQTFHHPAGTVGLGRVLDDKWRVKGVGGLRVVDSSTFPSLPNCHLQATVYALANLVGKIIVEDDGCEI